MNAGQWLIADSTKIKVFSPWFPRAADNAIFTYEKIVVVGSPTLLVNVVEKSKDDPGNGTATSATFSAILGTSFFKATGEDLKELIRFQYELNAGEGGVEAILYRMLAPTWYSDAAIPAP